MRKWMVATILVLMFSVTALAQDNFPRGEFFAGYSYLRVNPGSGLDGVNGNGWEASLQGNFNKWFGVKGDFEGAYNGDLGGSGISGSVHNFLFGPVLTYRADKANFFVHNLYGVSHVSAGGVQDNSWAMAVGGGLDYKFNDKVGWRVVQVDYLLTNFYSTQQHNARVSTGITFYFGR